LETSAMSRQRLGQRIPSIEKMASEVQAWLTRRNNMDY
jgi:hypothetical protein